MNVARCASRMTRIRGGWRCGVAMKSISAARRSATAFCTRLTQMLRALLASAAPDALR
jgi:hypothetical protein